MKDLLFRRDREWIQHKLYSNYSGMFCVIEVDEEPELTGEGQKVLFSDGDQIIGESHILEVNEDSIRFDPLVPVRKPHPETPPEKGFEYVDAEECGRYSIELVGIEHEFETFHDLVKGILKKREAARNSEDVLCHIIWTEVQDLDLNNIDEFSERLGRGKIAREMDEVQVQKCFCPPTDPEVLVDRFKSSKKGSRLYESISGFTRQAKSFYRERGRDELVEKLNEVDVQTSTQEKVNSVVKQKVSNRDFPK